MSKVRMGHEAESVPCLFWTVVLRLAESSLTMHSIIGGSCYQYHFCRDKSMFVARKKKKAWTYFCRDKHNFVATKDVFCRNKHVFVATNTCFIATKLLSRQKLYLWQLPPIIALRFPLAHRRKIFSFGVFFVLFFMCQRIFCCYAWNSKSEAVHRNRLTGT